MDELNPQGSGEPPEGGGRKYRCELCTAFMPNGRTREDDGVALGRCFVRGELGEIPGTYAICARYAPRPGAPPPPSTKVAGAPRGAFSKATPERPRSSGGSSAPRRTVAQDPDYPTVRPPAPAEIDIGGGVIVDREALKHMMRELLEEETGFGETPIHPRFAGGTVTIHPREEGLQSKEIPIDALFHKVVMVRDRLRVLEAKINGNSKLSDTEKAELQQYITKSYGSLTTFNILFSDNEDKFSSKG